MKLSNLSGRFVFFTSLIFLCIGLSGQSPPPKVITLMLRVEEVEIVLKGLGKLPLEESGNIFFNVKNQAERQMSAPPDTTGKKKEEPKTKKN